MDAFIWPGVVGICAIAAMFIFRAPLVRLIDRTRKLGKEGASFDRPQEEAEKPVPLPSFQDLMKHPVSRSVLAREDYVRKQFQSFDLKSEAEKVAVLIRAAALSRVEMEFNNISQIIFGSQLGYLVQLSGTRDPLPIATAEAAFAEAKSSYPEIHKDRSFEEWLHFLASWSLVLIEGGRVGITQYGTDFLKHIVEARLAYPRNG